MGADIKHFNTHLETFQYHINTKDLLVADNADITGIEVEVGGKKLHKSLDKYLNTIKNVLQSKIGSASLTNCNFRPVEIRGKKILKIEKN